MFRLIGRLGPVVAALFAVGISFAARGANFGVSPVSITLPVTSRATSLVVTNNDTDAVIVQATLYTWHKVDGIDDLQETHDLIVTPPIFRIVGGGQQVIRVARPLQMTVPHDELTYRLKLNQLPNPDGEAPHTGIITRMTLNLPIFVPPSHPEPRLEWRFAAMNEQQLEIEAVNTGNAHQQFVNLEVLDSQGHPIGKTRPLFYTLPGQVSKVVVELDHPIAPGARLTLQYSNANVLHQSPLPVP